MKLSDQYCYAWLLRAGKCCALAVCFYLTQQICFAADPAQLQWRGAGSKSNAVRMVQYEEPADNTNSQEQYSNDRPPSQYRQPRSALPQRSSQPWQLDTQNQQRQQHRPAQYERNAQYERPAQYEKPSGTPYSEYQPHQSYGDEYYDEDCEEDSLGGIWPFNKLLWWPHLMDQENYERFTGKGDPLLNASWLNRPYYIGSFMGPIGGDTLIAGEINQNGGLLWGLKFGWEYDYYWALETRLTFAKQGLDFLNFPNADNVNNQMTLWDLDLVYYPWGDSRWRPFVRFGLGVADFDFTDVDGLRHSDMVLNVPFGFGVKYRYNQHWAWQIDVGDNLIFGGPAGFETMNEITASLGLELHFGGTRRSYWPWNPSAYWR